MIDTQHVFRCVQALILRSLSKCTIVGKQNLLLMGQLAFLSLMSPPASCSESVDGVAQVEFKFEIKLSK